MTPSAVAAAVHPLPHGPGCRCMSTPTALSDNRRTTPCGRVHVRGLVGGRHARRVERCS